MPKPDLLETFENPNPDRHYEITHVQPEFTALCPVTGQPDFGKITVSYVAGDTCVELKSLKFYLQSFRDEGHFYEATINRILDDLVARLQPRRMTVTGDYTPRGGMHSVITATHPNPAM